MKRLIIFIFVLFTTSVKAQYNNGKTCDIIFVQGDTSLITGFNGLDKKDFGIYLGVKYRGFFNSNIFYTPYNTINRIGITKGYWNDGIRISGGVKITPVGLYNYNVTPEFGLVLHPIRLIGKDPYSLDIVLTYHQSDLTRVGFGVSFPIQYRNNIRI